MREHAETGEPGDRPGGAVSSSGGESRSPVTERIHRAGAGLTLLLAEADAARAARAEVAGDDVGSAVCAWNHFENIPTFYNWNNRPR